MNGWINLAIYQLVWFLCVLGGDRLAWIALLLVAVHVTLSPCRRQDLRLMGAVLGTGLVVDGLLNAIDFFWLGSDAFPIPLWLAAIWLALATLPNHSLRWMKHRYLLCALFGALGGPLAYWGGVRLDRAVFNWPLPTSLVVLAIVWGLIWPWIMWLSTLTVGRAKEAGRLSP